MKTARQKWTCVARRGWPHLLRFILEDTDHGLFDNQHSIYRRLSAPQKRELKALLRWLAEQAERENIRTADLEALHAKARAEDKAEQPELWSATDAA